MYKNNKIPSSDSNINPLRQFILVHNCLFVTRYVVVYNYTYTLHIKVLDILVLPPPGHGVLLAKALHLLRDLVPVLIMSFYVVGIVNNNFVSLAIVWRICIWIIACKQYLSTLQCFNIQSHQSVPALGQYWPCPQLRHLVCVQPTWRGHPS